MTEHTKTRDEAFQLQVARASRRLDRRRFIGISSKGVAAAVAMAVLGTKNAGPAFAHGTCYPPGGHYCTGCGADSTCPAAYITCNTSTAYGCGQCIYSSGWWYTGTAPYRHKCRDCRVLYCPCTCAPNYYGLCGCKSTTHY